MSGHTPSFRSLIYSMSTLLAGTGDPEAKLEQAVDLIALHLGNVTVLISLQISRSRQVASSERQSAIPLKSRFVFLRQIVVRGSSYGRFSLEVDLPKGGAA
jgi:hypothetical protein